MGSFTVSSLKRLSRSEVCFVFVAASVGEGAAGSCPATSCNSCWHNTPRLFKYKSHFTAVPCSVCWNLNYAENRTGMASVLSGNLPSQVTTSNFFCGVQLSNTTSRVEHMLLQLYRLFEKLDHCSRESMQGRTITCTRLIASTVDVKRQATMTLGPVLSSQDVHNWLHTLGTGETKRKKGSPNSCLGRRATPSRMEPCMGCSCCHCRLDPNGESASKKTCNS